MARRWRTIAAVCVATFTPVTVVSFLLAPLSGKLAERLGRAASLAGLNDILVYAAVLAFAGAIGSLLLVRPQDFGSHAH